jgi:hypothetical protein
MQLRTGITYLWKCLIGGVVFFVGVTIGSILALSLGLQPPPLPAGVDGTAVSTYVLVSSPILILALAFVAHGLPGGYAARTGVLTILTWIAYGVNSVLEASIITSYLGFSWFSAVAFGVAGLFTGAASAYLFPPAVPAPQVAPGAGAARGAPQNDNLVTIWYENLSQRPALSWVWRFVVAGVIFVPIYLFFGRLVLPVVEEYYRQQAFGLIVPGWRQLLPILVVRSLLFWFACLPIVMTWQGSRRSLALSLGFALFVLVGLVPMLQAYWLPATLRSAHSLEILAGLFVYAWMLTLLLAKEDAAPAPILPLRQARRAL